MHTVLYVMSVNPHRAVDTCCYLTLTKTVQVGCSLTFNVSDSIYVNICEKSNYMNYTYPSDSDTR
jgi:hypothetical protein